MAELPVATFDNQTEHRPTRARERAAAGPQSPDGQSAQQAAQEQEATAASAVLRAFWEHRAPTGQILTNVFSFRVLWASFLPAFIVAIVVGLVWPPLAYIGFAVWAVLWALLVMSPSTVAACPFCGKRVKMGASVCHHCGRHVA